MNQITTKKRGRPTTDRDIEVEVERLALVGWRPAGIFRKLQADERFTGRFPADVRTVERIVKRMQPRDPSAPWSFANYSGDEGRVILDALAAVIFRSEGRIQYLTEAEAALVAKISHVAPDVEPFYLWTLARLYLARQSDDGDSADVDQFLAFAPWRLDRYATWEEATWKGWAQEAPGGLQVEVEYLLLLRPEERERRLRLLPEDSSGASPAADTERPTVSNPVSNDARSVPVRSQSPSQGEAGRPDMTNITE